MVWKNYPKRIKRRYSRARKIQRFLSQPFSVAETLYRYSGKYVPLKETIRGFKAIIDGEMDEYPECILQCRNDRRCDGEKGILAHHENMVIAVEIGELRFRKPDGEWVTAVVSKGFADRE